MEGILITKKGLLEVGFIDDTFEYFLIKAKSDSFLDDIREVRYGFVLVNNKIYSCKYGHSKENYHRKIVGTGIVLAEVYSINF